VGACAGCDPHPDPPSDCATIRAQIEANNEQKLAEQNHAKITQNVAAGVVVVWPDSFAMDARRAAGTEMDALKSRQQYLATLAEQRCAQPAAPLPAPPRPPPRH
jgi:UDP:flavonoid glycosyltransferase YjiC (YdhE family)